MYKRYWICFVIVCAIVAIQVLVSLFAINSVTGDGNKAQKFPTQNANKNIKGIKSKKHPVSSQKDGVSGAVYDYVELADVTKSRIVNNKEHRKSFGVGSKAKSRSKVLNAADLSFVPGCDIKSRDAISAINRATTQSCKRQMANLTCLMQADSLFPKQLPSYCHLKDGHFGDHVGCFPDDPNNRMISGAKYRLGAKSHPLHCLNVCLQSGFRFAGITNVSRCYCGNDLLTSLLSSTTSSAKLPADACNLPCPVRSEATLDFGSSIMCFNSSPAHVSSSSLFSASCGGKAAINVFRTGLARRTENKAASEESAIGLTPVRIAFILTVTGRGVRQIKRLLNVIYSPNHFYYFHVDQRQDYLHRELMKLEENFTNVRVSRNRLATIWGGASLLKVLLNSMQDLLTMSGWSSSWDYVINLSESDFPIKSLERLELFLTANRGKNFIKSHGQDTQKFIAKQGLDRAFHECENRMWRLGRRSLPTGIRLDGGSDWIALTHEFASYIIFANNTLLRGLHTIYDHTLLPAESFFHTVLVNSEHCDTIIDNNLHVTNWKRRLGCKCQYKHVVDWCGCSPNVFLSSDWPRILTTQHHDHYFARKFDPVVDLAVINRLESLILDQPHGSRGDQDVSFEKYWQSIYDSEDQPSHPSDDSLSVYEGLARKAFRRISDLCHSQAQQSITQMEDQIAISQVHLLTEHNVFKGLLISFSYSLPDKSANADQHLHTISLEAYVRPVRHSVIRIRAPPFDRLVRLEVCSDLDQKEMMFRNWGCILSPFSELSVIHKWTISPKASGNFSITFAWIDPAGLIADASEVRIDTPVDPEREDLMLHHKPKLRPPLKPGVWRLMLLHSDEIAAESKFLISPGISRDGKKVTESQVASLIYQPRGQQANGYSISDSKINRSRIQKAILGSVYPHSTGGESDAHQMLHEEAGKAHPIGSGFKRWIDSLLSDFWSLEDICLSPSVDDLPPIISQKDSRNGGDEAMIRSDSCLKSQIESCLRTEWSSLYPDPHM